MSSAFAKRAVGAAVRSTQRNVIISSRALRTSESQLLLLRQATSARPVRAFASSCKRSMPGLMPHSEDPEPPKNEQLSKTRTAAPIDEDQYHLHADEFMNRISERAEEIAEQRDDVEVEFSAGVITITMPPNGTYVINKQPPNKQIWLSSPITGPARYDWSVDGESMDQKEGTGVGEWVYVRDGSRMSDLLRKELGIDVTVGDLEAQLATQSTDPVE